MENSFDYITENYNRIYNEIEAAKAKYRKPSDHCLLYTSDAADE